MKKDLEDLERFVKFIRLTAHQLVSAKPTEGEYASRRRNLTNRDKSNKSGQIITNNYFQTSNFKTQRLWFNFKFNLNDSFQTLISNSMFNYLNFNLR